MSRQATLIFAASFVCLLATAGEARPPDDCNQYTGHASAKMLPDGTVAVWFVVVDGGIIGEGYYEIAPSDPRYDEYLAHIGGLEPGEEKAEPPWLPAHCLPLRSPPPP